MKKYYFISGFHRSGSTLLAGILNQNPKFHASMSTNLNFLFGDIQFSYNNESRSLVGLTNNTAMNVYSKILEGYYQHIEKEVVFDTNRCWPRFDTILHSMMPYTKIICCVRDIPSILNSFEYYYKFVSKKAPSFLTPEGAANPWVRLEYWWQTLIAPNYESCEYAYTSPALKDLYVFIDYDDFISDPDKTIGDLYLKLELDYYQHDFNNISYSFDSIDERASNEGLHTVKTKVGKTDTKWVLPRSVVERYTRRCFWRE